MIGWRYHLISIVAVFLALALGLLIGTAFLNDRLVADLQARTEAIQVDRDAQAAQLRVLRQQAEVTFPFLVEDRLQGLDVVILTHPGSDEESMGRVRDALDRAGARTVTTLEVQPAFSDPSPDEVMQLAEIFQVPSDEEPATVIGEAWRALGRRLASGPTVGPDEDDPLAQLVLGEFLRAADPEIVTVRSVGGPDQSFVVVGGTPSSAIQVPSEAFVGLTQVLTEQGVTVAVAEDLATSVTGLVEEVRGNVSQERGPVVTVDDAADPLGGVALVLGLQRARESGQGGDYGLGEDADLLPPAA
jgi:hypothetical protein